MILGEASALYRGYTEREDYWQTRRGEVARAFTEFRNANPNASYSDFRSIIDNLTEGNSYLRGAVPSDQLLQTIVSENQRKAAAEQIQQRLSTMRQQAELSGTLESLAGRYALQYENDADIEDALMAAFGGDDNARSFVRQTFPSGFSGIRQRVMTEQTLKNLPVVTELLTANPDLDLSGMFPGMPPSFISSLKSSAQAKIDEAKALKERQLYATEAQLMATALDRGVEDYKFDPSLPPSVLSRLQSEFQQSLAERRKRISESERQRRDAAIEELRTKIKADPGILSAIRTQAEPTSALTAIRERAASMGVELSADDILNVYTDLRDDLDAAVQENFTALQTNSTIPDQIAAAQATALSSMTSQLGEDQPATKAAGAYAGTLSGALTILGQSIDLSDPAVASAIWQNYATEDQLASLNVVPGDAVSLANALLTSPEVSRVAKPLKQVVSERQRVALQRSGLPSAPTDFRSWSAEYQRKTAALQTQITSDVDKAISALLSSSETPLVDRVSALNQLEAALASEIDNSQTEIINAAQSSSSWLLLNTGPFDNSEAERLFQARVALVSDALSKVRRVRSQLENQASVSPGPAPSGTSPTANIGPTPTIEEEAWRGLERLRSTPPPPSSPPPKPPNLGPVEDEAWRSLFPDDNR